jgi:hypothetical protein
VKELDWMTVDIGCLPRSSRCGFHSSPFMAHPCGIVAGLWLVRSASSCLFGKVTFDNTETTKELPRYRANRRLQMHGTNSYKLYFACRRHRRQRMELSVFSALQCRLNRNNKTQLISLYVCWWIHVPFYVKCRSTLKVEYNKKHLHY